MYNQIKISAHILFCAFVLLTFKINAQDIRIYSGNNFTGTVLGNLSVGQSGAFTFTGCNGSIKILAPNIAIKVEMINAPHPYPFMFLYSEEHLKNIEPGTDQYCGKTLRIRCLPAARNVEEMPQPTAWIPIDRTNVNPPLPPFNQKYSVGDRVLMLKRAFIWENSEDLDCCHGPYGSLGLMVYPDSLLTHFNFDFDVISNLYREPWPAFPRQGWERFPGPIYKADNQCNDAGFVFQCLTIPDDPKSEWIDGPWGACFSRLPVYKWTSGSPSQVAIVLREGDGSTNDFMGGILVDRNNNSPILFKAWKFGWVELQNYTLTQADLNYNIDKADHYWMNSWNGANPSSIHSIAQSPPFDQFVPLPQNSINQMENSFSANKTIGLLGGEFKVTGKLDKPMKYIAPCEPAHFNN